MFERGEEQARKHGRRYIGRRQMFRVRDLRAVLAGIVLCAVVAGAVAAAQDGAETTEDLGYAYALARRTTAQGTIIETLLYAGRAIVTDVVMPAPGGAADANPAAAVTAAQASAAHASPIAAHADPAELAGLRPGFGGVLLSAEISDGYLVLRRTRTDGPVAYDIFRDGEKVGAVTTVRTSNSAASPGRSSFVFETAGDRFIVHLTQPDGTKIHATSVHGQLSNQAVEPASAVRAPTTAAKAPSSGQSAEQPKEAVSSITTREAAPQNVAVPPAPKVVPTGRLAPARALARPQARLPASQAMAPPVSGYGGTPQTAARSVPASAATTPVIKPRATVETVNARAPGTVTARPVVQAAKPQRLPATSASSVQRRATAVQP
jgi:hypothetical protein